MTLYAHYWHDIDLRNALLSYSTLELAPQSVVLLYSRHQCRFAVCDASGRLSDEFGHFLEMDDYFEARAFTETAELRWLKNPRDAQGRGAVAVLSERVVAGFAKENVEEFPLYQDGHHGLIDQTYLLWGEGISPEALTPGWDAGWGCLAAARIGRLPVPIPCAAGERIHLKVREYLGRSDGDTHGNISVIEERLIGLERIP